VQAYEFCPASLFKKGSSVICLKDSKPDGVLLKYEVSSDLKKDNALHSTLRSFLAANGCEIKKMRE
jgi:hypothetical protein